MIMNFPFSNSALLSTLSYNTWRHKLLIPFGNLLCTKTVSFLVLSSSYLGSPKLKKYFIVWVVYRSCGIFRKWCYLCIAYHWSFFKQAVLFTFKASLFDPSVHGITPLPMAKK